MKFRPNWRSLFYLTLTGIAYYACGRVLISRGGPDTITDIIWPPAGVGLAACLLLGNRAALPIAISAWLLSDARHPMLYTLSVPTALASAGEAVLGAFLLKKVIEPEILLRRVRGVIAFVFLGGILPTLAASTSCEIVHTLFGLHQWRQLPSRIFLWGQQDFLGMLIFTPVILAWSQKVDWKLRWGRLMESTLLFGGLAIVCLGAFVNWGGLVSWKPVYAYYAVPFLLWSTIRLGQRAAFAAAVVVTIFGSWGALLPGTWLTPNWMWGALIMVAGLQLFHSASMEEQKDTNFEQGRLASVLAATPDLVVITNTKGVIQYLNQAGRRMLGMGEHEDIRNLEIMGFHPPDVLERIKRECIPHAIQSGAWSGELVFLSREGKSIPVLQVILAHKNAEGKVKFLSSIGRDLTELKNAQTALHDSEKKFLQAQKMESIALLAGGIAHDFNNMLSVILGQSHLLSDDLGAESAGGQRLKGISDAALRAAGLTRQLLAFSRRQVLQPRVVNLNTTVHDVANMLKHLIGPNIEVRMRLDENLGNVNIDPGQLEQIIMNLAVNARDAMPMGGTLVIQTTNRELDASCAGLEEAIRPGQYVMLSVSDTGVGMEAETQMRIFEPFFTTKPSGQGTGLGLATVYGITKQSGGHIWVYSELGKGTTFGIYLPRVDREVRQTVDVHPRNLRGHESILLVEDEISLRSLISDILSRSGYTVLAASPNDALNIAARDDLRIDVLLTDMVMPKISGQGLAQRCLQVRRDLKVVYMSGYAPEIAETVDTLHHAAFVQKPFTSRALLEKIRQVLDTSRAAAGAKR